MNNCRVLVVDDELGVCNMLREILKQDGYLVKYAQNGVDALNLLESFSPHMVLLDVFMPEMNGMEILNRMRKIDKRVKIVMLSGMQDLQVAKDAIDRGAVDYLTKPVEIKELKDLIKKCVKDQVDHGDVGLINSELSSGN